jgi:protein-tyrosine phosphatase
MKREALVERLEEASLGNYQIIRDLIKVLEEGKHCKDIVDAAIDISKKIIYKLDGFLLNIRNQILISRVNYAVTKNPNSLGYALDCLERYFSLIVSKHYIEAGMGQVSFNSWMHNQRPEIWNMYSSIRKRRSEKLKIFRPIDDLSVLAETHMSLQKVGESAGEAIVVKNRSGVILSSNTILKSDHWQQPLPEEAGAPNFRQIGNFLKLFLKGNFPVFAVAQPTIEGIKQVLERASINDAPVIWINLREEPLVYINGEPYVLRDHFATLRNIKVFSGISRERLEGMEETLRDEVKKEGKIYEGRILVHEEVSGQLVATWETIKQVDTTTKVFSLFRDLCYFRIPITAEDAPDLADFDLFRSILENKDPRVIIVLNCQMGIGRSTIGTIISMLILKLPISHQPQSMYSAGLMNFEVITSLVRMLPDGNDTKDHLDQVIEACSQKFDLIKNIHDESTELKASFDPMKSSQTIRKLIFSLKRYFLLLFFTRFLKEENPEKSVSFKSWFDRHEEIKVLFGELEKGNMSEKIAQMSPSRTTPIEGKELWKTLRGRRGSVLAPLTILKFDHFPGCHRMSLPQKIEGAPNFRGIAISTSHGQGINIYGVAMPTEAAIRGIIDLCRHEQAQPRKLTWVCLREEPVIYVNGRPFVLRIIRDPNDNVAMTGIDTDRVELIEQRLLEEAKKEATNNNGAILLHEEGEEEPLVPMWEHIESIKTMSLVFSERDVTYHRLPITDEQAPIPKVFDEIARIVMASEDIIFNCQMGRGRTTTGMIITTIMTLISTNKPLNGNSNGGGGEDESKKYLAGEYRIIVLLSQLLPRGKASKQIADEAINLCSQLQNLREAIFSYKQKLHNPSITLGLDEEERRYIEQQGINYLLRYFYLICFSEYYLSRNCGSVSQDCGFEEWLGERREIGNLVRKVDFT